MTKKVFAFLLCALLVLGVTGCGSTQSPAASAATSAAAPPAAGQSPANSALRRAAASTADRSNDDRLSAAGSSDSPSNTRSAAAVVPPGLVTRSRHAPGESPLIPARMIKNCVYTCIYIWTKRQGSFWAYPVALTPEKTLHYYINITM